MFFHPPPKLAKSLGIWSVAMLNCVATLRASRTNCAGSTLLAFGVTVRRERQTGSSWLRQVHPQRPSTRDRSRTRGDVQSFDLRSVCS